MPVLKLTELETRLTAMHDMRDELNYTEGQYVRRLRAEDRALVKWFAERGITLVVDRDPFSELPIKSVGRCDNRLT